MKKVIDMCSKIKDKSLRFVLNPNDCWDKFDGSMKSIVNGTWHEAKFLDSPTKLHDDMSLLPNDSGGIYIFILKPEIVPATHLYILYVGRAKCTDTQNLRKRCREYLTDERPKVFSMIHSWGKDLYIRYLPLKDNNIIDKLEEELIESILPPCNDMYPKKITRQAMKVAFM